MGANDTRHSFGSARPWGRRLLVLGAIAASMSGAIAASAEPLAPPSPLHLPDLIAPDAPFYVTLSTRLASPSALQALGMDAESLFGDQASGSSHFLPHAMNLTAEGLFEDLHKSMGLEFATDVAPWLGSEVGLAIQGARLTLPKQAPKAVSKRPAHATPPIDSLDLVFGVTVRNQVRASAFMSRVRAAKAGKAGWRSYTVEGIPALVHAGPQKGDVTGFALLDGFLIGADNQKALESTIHRFKTHGPGLSGDAEFTTLLAHRSESTLGFAYVSRKVFAGLGDLLNQASHMDSRQSAVLKDAMAPLEGMAIDMGATGDSIVIDNYVHYDKSRLSNQMATWMKDASTPVASSSLDALGPNSVAFATFRIPPAFRESVLAGLKGNPRATKALSDLKRNSALDIDRDLFSWLNGETALVLLRDETSTLPFPYAGYLAFHPADVSKAQAGMKNLVQYIVSSLGKKGPTMSPEPHGDITWQVLHAAKQSAGLAGIGSRSNALYVAFGSGTMEQLGTAPQQPASQSLALANVLKRLPDPNGGVLFVDIETLVTDLGPLLEAVASDKAGDKAGSLESFFTGLKSVQALGVASKPGLDDNGILSGTLVVTFKK